MMAEDDKGEASRSAASLPTPTTAPALTTSASEPSRPPTLQLRRSSSGARARVAKRVAAQERLDGILEVILFFFFSGQHLLIFDKFLELFTPPPHLPVSCLKRPPSDLFVPRQG